MEGIAPADAGGKVYSQLPSTRVAPHLILPQKQFASFEANEPRAAASAHNYLIRIRFKAETGYAPDDEETELRTVLD